VRAVVARLAFRALDERVLYLLDAWESRARANERSARGSRSMLIDAHGQRTCAFRQSRAAPDHERDRSPRETAMKGLVVLTVESHDSNLGKLDVRRPLVRLL
jgi:hypothetical protein